MASHIQRTFGRSHPPTIDVTIQNTFFFSHRTSNNISAGGDDNRVTRVDPFIIVRV